MSELKQKEKKRYAAILWEELIPVMGYAEPITIMYTASVTDKVFGEEARRMVLSYPGDIIKNVEVVAVPDTDGQKRIAVTGILSLTSGNPEKQFEVTTDVMDSIHEKTYEFTAVDFYKVLSVENASNLYIVAKVFGDNRTTGVIIEKKHTNVSHTFRDEKGLEQDEAVHAVESNVYKTPRDHMDLKGTPAYAGEADPSEVREVLRCQVERNLATSQEGSDKNWGANIGSMILETFGSDIRYRACARAAVGSDAHMSGRSMPVVISLDSGNQGITVSMPVVEYVRELQVLEGRMLRALIVSSLVSVYVKHYISALSAFYGTALVSYSAGADINFLCDGGYAQIPRMITNTLDNIDGIVYDGAKPSCVAKIASSLHAAVPAYHMSMSNRCFQAGEGVVEDDVEETIKSMGYTGRVGMHDTDKEILRVMTGEVNVDDCIWERT